MNKLSFINPQWKVRKLQSFLYCALRHKETPHENDLIQYFFVCQGLVESELTRLFEEDKTKFYRIFTDEILDAVPIDKDKFEAEMGKMFKKMSKGYSVPQHLSFNKDILTPFLQTYSGASKNGKSYGSSYVDSVSSLVNFLFGINHDFTPLYKKFENIKIDNDIKNVIKINFHHDKLNEEFMNIELDGTRVETPCFNGHIAWHGENRIFNEHYIRSNPGVPIFITNSISQACKLQQEFVRLYYKTLIQETIQTLHIYDSRRNSNYEKVIESLKYYQNRKTSEKNWKNEDKSFSVWASWFGGVTALGQLDLSLLKNRAVYWVCHQADSTKKIVPKFLKIYGKINEIKLRDLQFIHVPEIKDKLNYKNTDIKVWSPEKLLLEAFDMKIEVPEDLKDQQAQIIAKERKKQSQEDYIIYPAIRRNSLMLLSARAKHGKSYLAMALSYAATTKGKLFSNWVVKQRAKVLYVIDREVDTSERKKRQDLFTKIFKPSPKAKSITFEPVFGFNLYEREYQEQIEEMIRDAQLGAFPEGEPVGMLVLDHLTKMTRGNLTANSWDSLRGWLDHLTTELNLAVLLLHHNNYSGGVYGTSFILNDVNVHIHVQKKEMIDVKDLLAMDLTIPDNRHGESFTEPTTVEISMGEKPYLKSDKDDIYTTESLWKRLARDEEGKSIVDKSVVKKSRAGKFIELKKANPKIKMKEIAYIFGIGLKSVEALAVSQGLTHNRWKTHKL